MTMTPGPPWVTTSGPSPKFCPISERWKTDQDFSGDFHGSDGPIPVKRYPRDEWEPHNEAFYEACVAAGFREDTDQNHPESEGVVPVARNHIDGVRISMALAYLDLARHRLNLTIKPNATARRVVFDGTRAVGVEVESGGEIFVAEAEEIILSSGAIVSPQLLLLSGVGPAAHLAETGIPLVHDLPGVGQNLRDHPIANVLYRTTGDKADAQEPESQVMTRYTAEGSHLKSDMLVQTMTMSSQYRPTQVEIGDDENYVGLAVCLYLAVGSGELKLASRDPSAQPAMDYRLLAEPFDRKRMMTAIRLAAELAEHPALRESFIKRVTPTDEELATDEALDGWLMKFVGTGDHVAGTCKMGPVSDSMAVVDQYCKVHGVQNLRVVDAAVMPDVIRANTNATTIMIAEKVSDFIKESK